MSRLEKINIDFSYMSLEHKIMQTNADGSYTVIVGAFNIWSGNGHFYEYTDLVKSIYAEGSILQQRVEAGDVLVEDGHPPYVPGMDVAVYLESLMTLTESKVCGKILRIKLDDNPTVMPGHSQPVYLVKANIIPFGDRQEVLERSFKNPNSNTAFSIRGLNHAKRIGGVLYKETHTVMTYDFVRIPGISLASKSNWEGISLESMDITLSPEDIAHLSDRLDERSKGATEAEELLISEIRNSISGCSQGDCIYKQW